MSLTWECHLNQYMFNNNNLIMWSPACSSFAQCTVVTAVSHTAAATVDVNTLIYQAVREAAIICHALQVVLWPFDLESGVRVTCKHVTWATSVPKLVFLGLCSRFRPDVRDRQTDWWSNDECYWLQLRSSWRSSCAGRRFTLRGWWPHRYRTDTGPSLFSRFRAFSSSVQVHAAFSID